jgi:GT2 family glycosyltransferase
MQQPRLQRTQGSMAPRRWNRYDVPMANGGLHAILVNYRCWRDAASCVQYLALAGLPPEQVVVVDCDSRDGSAERLRAHSPMGTVLALGENLGFAGGCNRGAGLALERGAEALMFLNTDTAFRPDFLSRLLGRAGDLATACVSPEIYWAGQPRRPWSAGAWRGRVPGTLRPRQPGDPERAVDYLYACCLVAGRAVWERVGPFDPGYFLYYEDMDWSRRARRLGTPLTVEPRARLWHAVGASTGGASSALRRYHLTRSSVRFFRGEGPGAIAVRCLLDARTALRLAALGQHQAAAAHLAGWRDGWRSP